MPGPRVADDPTSEAREVRREESEVSSWPRGLVSYTPSGRPEEGPPPEEEDRVAQRIRLAARLMDLLRSLGTERAEWRRELAACEAAYRAGQRTEAAHRVDRLIGELGAEADRSRSADESPR
ncbi:MAG: hypothetical protein ACREB9_03130 [Thermoplasmata archaeon]